MRYRRFLLLLLSLELCAGSRAGYAAEPTALPRALSQPCSLRKVCAELSRRLHLPISPAAELAETRVSWAFAADPSLNTTLNRLAELLGARVVDTGTPEKPRYVLEPRRETAIQEANWRREALRRPLTELVRAADEYDRKKLNPDAYPPGIRTILQRDPARCRYIRLLTPPLLDRLLAGERLTFPPTSIPEAEVQATAEGMHPEDDPQDGPARSRIDGHLQSFRKHGLSLYLNRDTPGCKLALWLAIGRSAGASLCLLREEDLGLPHTRTSPYRRLETAMPEARPETLPPALLEPLAADVPMPEDRLWHSALGALGPVAKLNLVSDGYLSRSRSRSFQSGPVLVRRGTPIAEALDTLCESYRYLWWEKDGTVYFRAQAWPWDVDVEPPDRFVDTWSAAIRQRRVGAPELAALASLTPLQWIGLKTLGWNAYTLRSGTVAPVREFLRMFAAANPAQRVRLQGAGERFTAEQAVGFPEVFAPYSSVDGEGPVRLQLQSAFKPSDRYAATTRVSLTLVRTWPASTSPIRYAFEMPQLPDPFIPPAE